MVHLVDRYHPDLSHRDLWRGLSSLDNTLRQPDTEASALRDLGSTIVLVHAACVGQFAARPVVDVDEANRSVGLRFDRIVAAVTVTPTKGEPR